MQSSFDYQMFPSFTNNKVTRLPSQNTGYWSSIMNQHIDNRVSNYFALDFLPPFSNHIKVCIYVSNVCSHERIIFLNNAYHGLH